MEIGNRPGRPRLSEKDVPGSRPLIDITRSDAFAETSTGVRRKRTDKEEEKWKGHLVIEDIRFKKRFPDQHESQDEYEEESEYRKQPSFAEGTDRGEAIPPAEIVKADEVNLRGNDYEETGNGDFKEEPTLVDIKPAGLLTEDILEQEINNNSKLKNMRRHSTESKGYMAENLSPAERLGVKPEDVVDLDVRKDGVTMLHKKKNKKEKEEVFARGTDPTLEGPSPLEDDFSDEPTKVFKRKPSLTEEVSVVMEGLDKAEKMAKAEQEEKKRMSSKTSRDVKDAMADIGVQMKETDEALEMVRETAVQSKKARQIAEEVEDIKRIRDSIKTVPAVEESEVKKLDKEIKAGFKSNANENVGVRKSKAAASSKESAPVNKEVVLESEKVKNARMFAENAIRTYSKLYIEYDPKAISKLYEGKKNADELVAALDLTAITPPPFKAIFTSKGRQLRDVYGKVQEAIKRYNDEVEAQ